MIIKHVASPPFHRQCSWNNASSSKTKPISGLIKSNISIRSSKDTSRTKGSKINKHLDVVKYIVSHSDTLVSSDPKMFKETVSCLLDPLYDTPNPTEVPRDRPSDSDRSDGVKFGIVTPREYAPAHATISIGRHSGSCQSSPDFRDDEDVCSSSEDERDTSGHELVLRDHSTDSDRSDGVMFGIVTPCEYAPAHATISIGRHSGSCQSSPDVREDEDVCSSSEDERDTSVEGDLSPETKIRRTIQSAISIHSSGSTCTGLFGIPKDVVIVASDQLSSEDMSILSNPPTMIPSSAYAPIFHQSSGKLDIFSQDGKCYILCTLM